MAADPRTMRASDQDRDRTAALLREHHAVGRLTPEEFSERLDQVFAAKTIGDLDDVLADLPGIDLYRLPDASVPRRHGPIPGGSSHFSALQASGALPATHGRLSPLWQAAWGSWLSISLLCFVVWAASGAGYPWPVWVAGPLGALMLGRWITGGPPGGGLPGGRGGRPVRGHDQHRALPGDHDPDGGTAPLP